MTDPTGDSIITITDSLTKEARQLSVSFVASPGYNIMDTGWAASSAGFKGGGTYGSSVMNDGNVLRHVAFDNVLERFTLRLQFEDTDNMIKRVDDLEELLLNRAPAYFEDRHNNNPVYIIKKLDGESNSAYAVINTGTVTKPKTWLSTSAIRNQIQFPVRVQINRQPFWHGAIPGSAQKAIEISAQQDWPFAQAWAVDDTSPTGQTYCLAEITGGTAYAGGASEILIESAGSWAAVATAPVTLSGNITAAIELANGDFLFGDNGQIVKLSGGTWSVETSSPVNQVESLIEAESGEIYAGENGVIWKRNVAGTWASEHTVASGGYIYDLVQTSNGRIYAAGEGEILRTSVSAPTEFAVQVAQSSDDAEEANSTMSLTSSDLDMFNKTTTLIGLRFQNVTIPQGATISSAIIRFVADDTDTGISGTALIYCEDIDNATTFTSTDDDITDRTLTTASDTWTNIESWVSGNSYDTDDISSSVQEVINRGSWASGNALNVIITFSVAGEDRDAEAYDSDPGNAAELIIEYSTGGTATWEVNTTFPSGDVRSLAIIDSVIFGGESSAILASADDGDTWANIDTSSFTGAVTALRACSGVVYAGDTISLYKSGDGGYTWAVDDTLPAGPVHDVLCHSDDETYAADNSQILVLAADTNSPGQEASSTNPVMIANKHNEAQLTHIKILDFGTGFSDIYPAASFPVELFPAIAVANDAVHFGCNTGVNDSGIFTNLVFDLSTGASAATSYTLIWEYYNGSWVTLTTQDGTESLSAVGVNSVSWEPPSDWATNSVDSITGYWVRARISAVTGKFTNPVQQTRDVYTAVTPYIEVAALQTLGTIDSLAQLTLLNRSDASGANPELHANRFLAGIMPVSDHDDFRAFLNFADEQNPTGVSVDVSVDGDSASSFVDNFSAATGRAVFFNAGTSGISSIADRIKITLATTVARDYYGIYRAFLRGKQTGGTLGEVSVRLKISSGSGGIDSFTDTLWTQSTSDHELFEFEELLYLPPSSLLTPDELGDETSITLQIGTAATDADFYAYDLFLLPTNLMYVDAKDEANTATSIVGNDNRMLIDSITVPKLLIRAVNQKTSGLAKGFYRVDSNGEMRILNNKQQRLWILTAQTSAAGSDVWLSKPEALHSATVNVTDRWITGRGSN